MPGYRNELERFIYEKCYDHLFTGINAYLAVHPQCAKRANSRVFVPTKAELLDMILEGIPSVWIDDDTIKFQAVVSGSVYLEEDQEYYGTNSCETNVYVFRVGEAHQKDDIVRFIDFSVDGYTRTNRKKASVNLRDTDHAKERYAELVDLVRFGKGKLHYYTEKEYYEGTIDPDNGADWNQTAPIDTRPTLEDFKKTVSDYLAWEVSNLLKSQDKEDDRLGK